MSMFTINIIYKERLKNKKFFFFMNLFCNEK